MSWVRISYFKSSFESLYEMSQTKCRFTSMSLPKKLSTGDTMAKLEWTKKETWWEKRLSIDISVCSVWTICKREPRMCVIEPRNSLKERRWPQKWEAFLFSLYFTLSHSSPSQRFYSRPNCLFKMHTKRKQLRLKETHFYTNSPLSIIWSQSLWILIGSILSIFIDYSNCFRVT